MIGADVVVAGGGLVGAATAWRAARAGLRVVVVDDAPGSGASHAAAGMLAPVSEVDYGEDRLLPLALASLERYPSFLAELAALTGRQVALRTAGTLAVGFDADDAEVLAAQHRYQLELGLPARRLTPRECRRIEPALSPRVRTGVHLAGDHSVDPRALHETLLRACAATGVVLVRERAEALVVEAGRAVGLRLAGGTEVRGGSVVLALGAWSGRLQGVPQGAVPVRPVKGQVLRLRWQEPLLTGTVRALVRGRSVYLVPYGRSDVVVGATVEEQGFDRRVTAGAVHDLLHDAAEVVPDVVEAELLEAIARFRPGTPDNAPLLGPSELPGLVLACGHHRNGVLLTPATADALAAFLVTGALVPPADALSPSRFAPSPPDAVRQEETTWT